MFLAAKPYHISLKAWVYYKPDMIFLNMQYVVCIVYVGIAISYNNYFKGIFGAK